MSDIAIKVEGLGKEYIIGQQKQGDIMNSFSTGWKQLFQKGKTKESFWALKDLNFEIKKGEAVGIIGRNGAGKSTLLKILSRITEPTTGRFEINGRVSSLLEVGTGFHPELTGRENIYLNGTILGMNRREIKQKFDEIVEFSGVEKFLDTPVKHYSSGMKVRLAFSVAAHLEPEILIIDEVLAVGDAEFQKKCLGKMDEVSKKEGRTIIFVSHDMNAIQRLCSRGFLLKDGKIQASGGSSEVIDYYSKNVYGIMQAFWEQKKELAYPHFKNVQVKLEGKQPVLTLKIAFTVESVSNHLPAFVAFDIINSRGSGVMQAIPQLSPFIQYSKEPQIFECKIVLQGLVPDNYHITAWMGSHNSNTYDIQKEVVNFEVIDSPTIGRTYPHTPDHGAIVPFSDITQVSQHSLTVN